MRTETASAVAYIDGRSHRRRRRRRSGRVHKSGWCALGTRQRWCPPCSALSTHQRSLLALSTLELTLPTPLRGTSLDKILDQRMLKNQIEIGQRRASLERRLTNTTRVGRWTSVFEWFRLQMSITLVGLGRGSRIGGRWWLVEAQIEECLVEQSGRIGMQWRRRWRRRELSGRWWVAVSHGSSEWPSWLLCTNKRRLPSHWSSHSNCIELQTKRMDHSLKEDEWKTSFASFLIKPNFCLKFSAKESPSKGRVELNLIWLFLVEISLQWQTCKGIVNTKTMSLFQWTRAHT